MSEYSETFLDHFEQPRNLGDFDDPDAVAIVHESVCGDVLRLAVKLVDAPPGRRRRRIGAARFKAYGCAAAIAVGSVATELIVDRTPEEIAGLDEDDLIAALDGLPPQRRHAAILGREVVRKVLEQL